VVLVARIFELSDDIRQIAEDAISDLIDQLGKDCRLVYPPSMRNCDNCTPDTIGRKSTNRYRDGGPMPFSVGTCPMCNGTSKVATENSEVIRLLCDWSPSQYTIAKPGNIRIPDGYVETKGYVKDLPKVKKCQEMILQTDIEPYCRYKYTLAGEPVDSGNIVQGKFFVCLWRRSG
jgi:hypothetical protein